MARIPYDQTSPFGSKVYLIAQRLAGAQSDLLRCIDEANAISGGGATPTKLEVGDVSTADGAKQFGVAAGQGANFYNALQSIKSAIVASGARLQATIDLDQG